MYKSATPPMPHSSNAAGAKEKDLGKKFAQEKSQFHGTGFYVDILET
jgi:hypothetical protein